MSVARRLAGLPKGEWITDPSDPGFQPQWQEYGKTLTINTVGGGIGLSVILGALMSIMVIVFCCRCRRMRKVDRAIEDGKGFQYDQTGIAYKAAKHRRILWVGSLLIFLFYIGCAGYTYKQTLSVRKNFNAAYKGTDTFMTDMQNALCTVDGAQTCEKSSLGDFLTVVVAKVGTVLDEIVVWFASLGALAAPLNSIAGGLATLHSGSYTPTLVKYDDGEAALIRLDDYNSNAGYSARYGLQLELPVMDNTHKAQYTGAMTAIDTASDAVAAAADSLEEATLSETSPITRVSRQIDGTAGNEVGGDENLRQKIADVADGASDKLRDLTKQIYSIQTNELEDANASYQEYAKPAGMGIAAFVFLPAIGLLLMTALSACCRSPKPLYFNMCHVFFIQGIYCLLGGILLILGQLSSDICTSHKAALVSNFDKPITIVKDSTVTWGGAAVAVLECKGKKGNPVSPTNNLVNIFQIGSLFDVSKPLQSTADAISGQKSTILAQKALTTTVSDAITDLAPALDVPDVVEMRADFVLATEQTAVTNMLAQLPLQDFDRDDTTEQSKYSAYYLGSKETSLDGWNWAEYTTRLQTFNDALNDLDFSAVVPGSPAAAAYAKFLSGSVLFEDIRGADDICAAGGDFEPDPSTPANSLKWGIALYNPVGEYTALCTASQPLEEYTADLNTAELEHTAYLAELAARSADLITVDTALVEIAATQADADATIIAVNGDIADMDPLIDDMANELDDLTDTVMSINDTTKRAPEFAMCGFVGKFYQDVYVESVCGGFNGNLRGIGAPLLAVAVIAFLSFFLHGCCGPALRSRPGTVVPVQDEEDMRKDGGGYYAQTPKNQQQQPILGTKGR